MESVCHHGLDPEIEESPAPALGFKRVEQGPERGVSVPCPNTLKQRRVEHAAELIEAPASLAHEADHPGTA